MGATIIVGGQTGNEGKTKVLNFWNAKNNFDAVITMNGNVCFSEIPMQIVPRLVKISNLEKFVKDIEESPINDFMIDQYTEVTSISEGWTKYAQDVSILSSFVYDVEDSLCNLLNHDDFSIVIEGDYGYEKSHQYLKNQSFPDTTAPSIVSRCGISIFDVDEIIMVYKLVNGELDITSAIEGIKVTNPNIIVINGFDTVKGTLISDDDIDTDILTSNQIYELQKIERLLNVSIDYIGADPKVLVSVDEVKTMNGIIDILTNDTLSQEIDDFVEDFKNTFEK